MTLSRASGAARLIGIKPFKQRTGNKTMLIIIAILLFIIACTLAPDVMEVIFSLLGWLIKAAFVLAVIGGAIALVMNA